MSNLAGKAYGFTALTPMKPWKTPLLRAFLSLIPLLSTRLAQRLLWWFPLAQDQKRLLQLSFIHFARWSIIGRRSWPRTAAEQRRERPRYDYLLFASNFNGTWEQYIEAFSQVIPGGMNGIWYWSEKYPGARPITPFLDYIRRVQFDNEYYYSAYPGASANDVKSALHLAEELQAFAGRSQGLSATDFARAYERFLTSVQGCLGSTGLDPYVFDWEEEIVPGGLRIEGLVVRGIPAPAEGAAVGTIGVAPAGTPAGAPADTA
jgi:hypothetical protein